MPPRREFNRDHPIVLAARGQAFARSGGRCQFCGQREAEHGHHWEAMQYPREEDHTGDDFTALCKLCHKLATTIRRFRGNIWDLESIIEKGVDQCYTTSPSEAPAPSSCTTERPDSIPAVLPTSRRQKLRGKRGGNRTASDDARLAEIETQTALYLDQSGAPTLPAAALRACIETAARKLKQGPQVREGLIVDEVKSFDYDKKRYGTTLRKLVKSTQFTVGVVVQRNRILRTRAKFDEWSCTFAVEGDDELVDKEQLEAWLDIGGRPHRLG